LAQQGAEVILFEQASDLLTRASYNNQARLHNGYHYPRSFSTAYRSRLNFSRFLHDYRPAIATNFVKLYAIALNLFRQHGFDSITQGLRRLAHDIPTLFSFFQ
jgi:hypothetical protein